MAIYSTFFVADSAALTAGFPGWRMPLEVSVDREVTDFFGENRVIQTREPLWDGVDPDSLPMPEYGVVTVEGDYEAYLEQRIPKCVQAATHWCSKGLTEVELNPIGEIVDGVPALDDALFSHPAISSHLQFIRSAVIKAICNETNSIADQWAKTMSTPEYTHSADGSNRLNPDWTPDDALAILGPLRELSETRRESQQVYLLMEW